VAALDSLPVHGIGGKDLQKEWRANGSQSLYGSMIHDFPNFFFLLGPYSALGHNSVILMMEAQIDYMADLILQVREEEE